MGRYPVLLQCFMQMIKHWQCLEMTAEENTPVKQAFLGPKYIFAEQNHDWLSSVRVILNHCRLLDAWNNPLNFKCKQLTSMCKRRLQRQFQNYWKHSLSWPSLYNCKCMDNNRNKLRTFKSF